jgi:hypothetical protein
MKRWITGLMSSPRVVARNWHCFSVKHCFAVLATVASVIGLSTGVVSARAPDSASLPEALTPAQAKSMTPCFYNAEMVVRIAQAKSQGLTHEAATQRVQPPNPQIQAIIDTVYAASFDNAWNYTIKSYDECAERATNAPLRLVQATSFCMQNGLISDSAAEARRMGVAKEMVYDRYKQFLSQPQGRMAIDSVYAEDKLDGHESWRTYSWCVGLLTNYPGQSSTGG